MVADDVLRDDVQRALGQLAVKFLEQERRNRTLLDEEVRIVDMQDHMAAGEAMARWVRASHPLHVHVVLHKLTWFPLHIHMVERGLTRFLCLPCVLA